MPRVSSKGGIVIPAEIRAAHGIEPGDEVDVVGYGDVIVLLPHVEDAIAEGRGMFADDPSLTEAFLEDRRLEREREEAKIYEGARDAIHA